MRVSYKDGSYIMLKQYGHNKPFYMASMFDNEHAIEQSRIANIKDAVDLKTAIMNGYDYVLKGMNARNKHHTVYDLVRLENGVLYANPYDGWATSIKGDCSLSFDVKQSVKFVFEDRKGYMCLYKAHARPDAKPTLKIYVATY